MDCKINFLHGSVLAMRTAKRSYAEVAADVKADVTLLRGFILAPVPHTVPLAIQLLYIALHVIQLVIYL